MAQAAAVVINDGQVAPVATTFTPEQVTPQLSTFVDRSSGVAARFRRLSVRFEASTASTKRIRSGLSVSIPVWGVLPSGASGVLYTLRAKCDMDLPENSTDAERKDLHAFIVNGLANTLVKGAVRDIDPLY
jgi:hypothetical protein